MQLDLDAAVVLSEAQAPIDLHVEVGADTLGLDA